MSIPENTIDELAGFPVVIQLPVLWGDMDAFGHVNNTVLFRWFESARIRYLEQTGMEARLDTHQLGPILAAINCNYRHQLHYPDTVSVATRVVRLGRSSMTMEHVVYSQRLATITADGTGTVVVFNFQTNRPTRIPEDVRAAVEQSEGKSLT